jgi:hypothetical protein
LKSITPARIAAGVERGGDQQKILSQAAAIRGQERNFTRNGESCKRLIDMLHNHEQKSKGEKLKFSTLRELSRAGKD